MKLTVRELVAFGRFPYSGNHLNSEDVEIVNRAIGYMELEKFQDRFIDELSGGSRFWSEEVELRVEDAISEIQEIISSLEE